jgi:hypothetical protein
VVRGKLLAFLKHHHYGLVIILSRQKENVQHSQETLVIVIKTNQKYSANALNDG